MAKSIKELLNDPNLLRKNIFLYDLYLQGARDMVLKLREHLLLEEPHPGDARKVTMDDKVINKATVDLILSSKTNCDRFLMEEFEIHLTDHEKDRKGKLVKCRAFFAKKVVGFVEVK